MFETGSFLLVRQRLRNVIDLKHVNEKFNFMKINNYLKLYEYIIL